MNTPAHTAYLIDGSGYIFRAFYGVQALSTKDGFPTNALYGFVRMLFKTLTLAASERVVVVFDAGRKTFRNDLDPEYKANRSECPPELLQQMPYFRDLCVALGVNVLEQVGYEADDIIGTLVDELGKRDWEVVVVSGDKDLMQLVTDRVKIWDTMKDKRYGIAQVVEKFGVTPDKVVEVLALMGDASDNVAGLDGVGPKTAAQLIEKYQSVEGVISNSAALREDSSIRNRKKIADAIESNPARLRLSRKLVEIDRQVPLIGGSEILENIDGLLTRRELDTVHLGELFAKFEFSTLIKEFPQVVSKHPSLPAINDFKYRTILAADFPAWLEEFKAQLEFSFDIETTSLAIHEAKIVGLSFCWHDSEASYIPIAHIDVPETQVLWSDFKANVLGTFANSAIKKCGQNVKYDISILELHGIAVRGVDFDSMIAAYLLNPDSRSYNLTALAADFLSLPVIEFNEVTSNTNVFASVALEPATKYACQDAHYAWLLKGILLPRIEEEGLTNVFSNLEIPLIPVLAHMERSGIAVDLDVLRGMSAEFQEQLLVLEQQIYATAGSTFNINSTKQLAEILFVQMAIPTKGLKKTKTGISTDSSVLEKLAEIHPLPKLILDYRLLHKLKSTYTDALAEDVSVVTGRVHTKLNQTIAGTGRLSSTDPNLQNIPIRSPEGRRIRSAFIPAPKKILISADYSQIELRLLAHMSEDANLIRAFKEGLDIHASTAREIMGLGAFDEITSEVRRVGKTINFGIVYGMGAFRLSRELGISVSKASAYINNYFDRYPRVKEYFKRLEDEAMSQGSVRTIFGRKRMIGSLDTTGRDQGFAMRAAINAPIQGSAADIIKLAMIKVEDELRSIGFSAELVLQIHDELLIECDDRGEEENNRVMQSVITAMESTIEISVPLRVEAGMGYTWQEAQS